MRYFCRGMWMTVFAALVLLVLTPVSISRADTRTYGDVAVSVNAPVDGESGYGYVAYRVSIVNRSKNASRIKIQIPAQTYGYGASDVISRMTRTVDLEAGAATSFQMLQPPVTMQGSGAAVYINGARQRRDVNVPIVSHMGYSAGQLVLVSRDVGGVIKESIDTAIEDDTASGTASGVYPGGYGYRGGSIFELVREPRPLVEWGTNWLGYTRYMTVLLSENDFTSMTPELSDALRSYVLTGGTVAIVFGSAEAQVPNDWLDEWPGATNANHGPAVGALDFGMGTVHLLRAEETGQLDSKQWIEQLNQWHTLAASRAAKRSTEDANRDLPIVEGQVTPARGLLLVMLIFAVVIGPVNVMVLWMLKRRMLLLVTVPVIALFFSAAVMVYALISEGITPQARTAALTILDQRSRRALTFGVNGYYAPLTPANGLWFDENTMVTPQFEQYGYGYYGGSDNGRSRTLDVTHGQHMASGWVAARVPAHVVIRKSERRNERLQVSTDSDGAVSVVNGLGSDIKELVLVDASGTRWTAKGITAGQSVALTPSVDNPGYETPSSVAELVRRDDWSASKSVRINPDEFLTPGSYVAELGGSAFLDPGLENLKEHRTDCIVLGYFAEAR